MGALTAAAGSVIAPGNSAAVAGSDAQAASSNLRARRLAATPAASIAVGSLTVAGDFN